MARETVTLEDVARAANVSRALVSLVMRDSPKVAEATRSRVKRVANELGYVPNRLASQLASKKTKTIGLVLLNFRNTVFSDIHDGVQEALTQAGYQTVLLKGSEDRAQEQAALDSLMALRVDGIAIAGYMGSAEMLSKYAAQIPVVVITRQMSEAGISSVFADDYAGAQLATQHLLDEGHRQILFISTFSSLPYSARRDGYTAIMRENYLEPWVIEAAMTEDGGRTALTQAIDAGKPFTAIFANNDLAAVGAMEELSKRGIRVPQDVAVVGYDYSDFAQLGLIGLSSIDQRAHQQGVIAATTLLELIDADERQVQVHKIQPELRISSSSTHRGA